MYYAIYRALEKHKHSTSHNMHFITMHPFRYSCTIQSTYTYYSRARACICNTSHILRAALFEEPVLQRGSKCM